MSRIGRFAFGLVVIAGFAAVTPAAIIQISSPSFETPDLPDGTQQLSPQSWTISAGAAYTRDPAAGDVTRTSGITVLPSAVLSTDGSQVAKLDPESAMYIPLLGYQFANGQTWSLQVDFAWTSEGAQNTMRTAYLRLTTADQLASVGVGQAAGIGFNPSLSADGWTTLTFTGTLSNATAFVGKTPVIELMTQSSTGSIYFDNLRGTTTAPFDANLLPEPASLSLLATAALPILARRRRA
jgi:hypothetical protein